MIAGSGNEKDSSRFPSDVDKEEWDEEQKVLLFSSRNVVPEIKLNNIHNTIFSAIAVYYQLKFSAECFSCEVHTIKIFWAIHMNCRG